MRHRYSDLLLPFQIVADTLLLNLSFYAAFVVRFRFYDLFAIRVYVTLILIFNLVWFFLLVITKPYRFSRISFNADKLLTKLVEITFLHASVIALLWVFAKGYIYSRGQLALTYAFFFAAGVVWRFGALLFIKLYRASGHNTRRYIVVGYGELSESITGFYDTHPEMGYTFHGYFGENKSVKVRGGYDQIEEFVQAQKIDFIYCCMPYVENQPLQEIIKLSELHQTNVKLVIDFRGFLTNKATLEYHDYMPVIQLSTKPYSNVRQELAKRTFDLAFSLFAVTVGSPIFLLIAILVKCSSKGPIFYRQERSGRWGHPFRIYKFRSMYTNADEVSQLHSQGDNDPRITAIGRHLRKTRLDEIPQFFNVIKGDMSIVGPRPLARYDVDMLMAAAPESFRKILTVRPGITSIGQIKVGYSDNTASSVKRLKYDLAYLENPSLQVDIWLIVRTFFVMIQGKGK
ncbi:sugar transferase [Persicitalea sp.]|uniref:sugar transferase n=1 Tax=Persicitalea sp. TaxID=3100273 RepID=UPI0035947C0D